MPTRSRRLLVFLPFLLLVPLGVMKWRADHPPLSQVERTIRRYTRNATVLKITGEGPGWRQMVGKQKFGLVTNKNEAAIQELVRALRLQDEWVPKSAIEGIFEDPRTTTLHLRFWVRTGSTLDYEIVELVFIDSGTQRAFLECSSRAASAKFRSHYVVVQQRFISQFMALVDQIVARAKAPGTHPEFVISEF